jgi:hypothetical protein
MLGIGAAAGLALLLDAADSSYHNPRQLQAALRIPVLTAIPSILLDPDKMRQRRRNVRDALAAVGISGVVLTSAVLGYVIVNKPHWIPGTEAAAQAEAAGAPAAPAAPAAPPAASPAAANPTGQAG